MNTNIVVIAGNLTKAPELRFTASGTAVAKFSIANNQRKLVGEEWVDDTSYFDVVVWKKQAERCAEHLTKGSSVLVEGKLKQNKWTDKEGNNRYSVEIIAFKVSWEKPKHHEAEPEDMSQHNQVIEEVEQDEVPF